MKVRVDIMLKEGVLDPQGKAINHALTNFGFTDIKDVRAGKTVEIDMGETERAKAMGIAMDMAKKLLANQVIEDFKVSIV